MEEAAALDPLARVPCFAICPDSVLADCDASVLVLLEAAVAELASFALLAEDAWFAAWFAAWLADCELFVEVTLEALFALFALFADALFVALAVFEALLVAPLLADELSVDAALRWLPACCAELAIDASVVALLLLALFAELALFVVDALLLALSWAAAFLEAVELLVAALLLALSFLFEVALFELLFNDPLEVELLLLLFVLSMLVVVSKEEFAPRR